MKNIKITMRDIRLIAFIEILNERTEDKQQS